MKSKKIGALVLAATLVVGLLAGCGGTESATGSRTTDENNGTPGGATSITFFHTKGEIHSQLEELVALYEEQTGVHVELQVAGAGESPYTEITLAYNAGTPPTLAMLDTTDVVALGETKAADLTAEDWVAECEDFVTRVDGTIYSFPFCIEGRGIIYNKAAIEEVLGESFDASAINSRDALEGLLQSLRDNGMENPMLISKEDWSLGAHQLQYIYETQDGTNEGTEAVIAGIKNGDIDLSSYQRMQDFLDTLDLLLAYNYNKRDPLGAVYEQDPIYLHDGDAALWFNGVWAWPNIEEAGASTSDEYGFLPYVLGNDTGDFANHSIQASASKQIMIDQEKATEEEIQAAKDFLSWMAFDEAGQRALVETCNIIPACTNNPFEPLDPLGADIKARMANGETFTASAIVPGDHWQVLGGSMQKYIAGQSSRDELIADIERYWAQQ